MGRRARQDRRRRDLRDSAQYYEGLDRLEIDRAVLGGPDLETRFNAPAGNVYHVDPLISRFGPLKPAAGLAGYRTPVKGLYLSGAGTHPVGSARLAEFRPALRAGHARPSRALGAGML